jgi:hypothetical protein
MAVPMHTRRWDQPGKPLQEFDQRELDRDASGAIRAWQGVDEAGVGCGQRAGGTAKPMQGEGRVSAVPKSALQSGDRGQFGGCHISLKPRPAGSGYEFTNSIKGGVISTKYVRSVDRGIQEAAQRGIVAGYPVVDF